MENLLDKSALVVDNGLFVSFAQTLSREFGKVLYWTPWWSAFPKSNDRLIGYGVPGVTRVNDLFDVIDKVDICIFPDVYMGDLQVYLEEHGKRVWGPRYGEELELNRWQLKSFLRKVGLPVPKSERIIGTEKLRSYLKEHEDVWIKVSIVRGDFETRYCETYELTEPWLDHLEHKLGAKKKIEEFIVEDSIDPAIETGYDGFTVDGMWPISGMVGFEIKDEGYLATIRPYADLPEPVKLVNEHLSDTLSKYSYRGNFSTEIRYTPDGKAYLIDPCTRMGSPPSEMLQEMFANWGEIMWHGSKGALVEPKLVAKYGCEILIHSPWADQEWAPVYVPEKIKPWVKWRNLCVIDGEEYVIPQRVGLPEIGAVVGIGDTLLEAIQSAKDNADQIRGFELDIKMTAVDEAIKQMNIAEEFGVKFSDDPLPDAEEVSEIINGNE